MRSLLLCLAGLLMVTPAAASTVGYALSGTLEDGGTFRGTFYYGVAEDSEPLKCYAIGEGFCRFTLKDWNVSVSGGFYDGVSFQGSGWDAVNNYGQYAGVGGVMGQMVSFADGYDNYLSVAFAGAFDNLRVAAPFQTDSLFAEGNIFGSGVPAPMAAFRFGAAAAPTDPVNIKDAKLSPVPEPGTVLLLVPPLMGIALLKKRSGH